MKLLDVVKRVQPPEPWTEGEKIPWHEPEFSARMLREHLSQEHDAASRRLEIVAQHVAWLHAHVLGGTPARVLDLGCGPGLYAQRLAEHGHTCVGIDFSPASVAYARQQAQAAQLPCTYHLADLRKADYGAGYGMVMLIYGEFNVFHPDDAALILEKAHAALLPGGALVLEPHTFAMVQQEGQRPPAWYTSEAGLFSARPHLVLTENSWDESARAKITRHYVVDATTGCVARHVECMQAYHEEEYRALLAEHGFTSVTVYDSLAGDTEGLHHEGLCTLVARKP